MKTFSSLVAVVLLVFCGAGWAEPSAEEGAAARVRQEMYEKAVRESQLRVGSRYPDAGKAGSPLERALNSETDRLIREKSPLLYCAEWPEYVAARLAADLGILPVKK